MDLLKLLSGANDEKLCLYVIDQKLMVYVSCADLINTVVHGFNSRLLVLKRKRLEGKV